MQGTAAPAGDSGRWVQRRTTAAREANAALTATLHEQLTGIRVLRLFGRSGTAVARVRDLSGRLAGANLATVRLRGGLQPVYTVLMTAGIVLVVWLGGLRVIAGAMTLGAFVAYLELYLRFVNRGFRVPQLVNSIQTGGAAYARLRPLLAPPLPVRGEPPVASFRPGHIAGLDRSGAMVVPAPAGARGPVDPDAAPAPRRPVAVAFDGVTFRYPGAATPALQGVTLDLPAGAFVAVTGPVGAGKSALLRALLGLYPLESGRVLLDGRGIETLDPAARAARVGYLPQDASLFSGSVRENVLLTLAAGAAPAIAGGASRHLDVLLDRAVSLAALEEDVRGLPQGPETEIGELGVRVSGGQRQRIALARAVAAPATAPAAAASRHPHDPPSGPGLLVLDDPFSAVDVDTEARIVAALREAFGPAAPPERRATILLCSHRLAAFPAADRVVVLERGRVAETGTHRALMRADGRYARIYRAQRRVHVGGGADERAAHARVPASS